MKYAAINIQGNILTSEILEKIRTEDIRYQKPIDFGFDPNTAIRDEISLAWSLATSHWKAFQKKRENLLDTDSGTTETRRMWVIPFLQLLGYDISVSNAEVINGKTYAISHRATNLAGFPIHIVGVNQSLDKRAETGGARLSPHALGQEYLNNHEHLYALVSNGKFLRVLRDATKLSQLNYLEFDLEQIFEENLYAEFALLFRLIHSSRLPANQDLGPKSIIELYHQEALESGARIRDRLSEAVEKALKKFANGFLKHSENAELRELIYHDKLDARKFFQINLRLIYRILFLMVIEERKLIFSSTVGSNFRKEEIYYSFYSIRRLSNLAEKLYYVDKNKKDLWQSLLSTFRLFEDESYGKALGIQPLGSGIFTPDALGILSDLSLDNESLLTALKFFTSFVNDNQQSIRVNYADLNVEELGSVYEGLLDLEPVFYNTEASKIGEITFDFKTEGMDRKTTGSYYTKPELVNELIKSSLVPVIHERLKQQSNKEAQIKSLLSLKVCDPAAGSGHMLLAAARTIAWHVASLRSEEEHPAPPVYRESLRDVINHCIYAVDFNPEAVELCKLALWLEGHNTGKPLSFLDHKIRNGNSLVGVPNLDILEDGIPAGAFKPTTGDEKKIVSRLKKENTYFLNRRQFTLNFAEETKAISKDFHSVEAIDQNDLKAVKLASKQFEELRSNNKKWYKTWTACNIWTAAFFADYTEEKEKALATSESLFNYIKNPAAAYGPMVGNANSLAITHKFFHWPLEFPDVYEQGGFDVMLGNPPWDVLELKEKEFFQNKKPEISKARNKSERTKLINSLEKKDPELFYDYQTSLKAINSVRKFVQQSTLFPLTGNGRTNLYSVFSELFSSRINPKGASGFIVPTGIATDDNNKYFFADIAENGRLISFFDFENRKKLFPDVDSRFKFSLISVGSPSEERLTRFGFFLHDVADLQDERQVFILSKDDFLNINPNTKTTPIFRTKYDAELTAKIYSRVPILVNEEKNQNPWGLSFKQGLFNMSSDSHLFKTEEELQQQGFILKGNRFIKNKKIFLPLYESKMIWHYNHRFGSFQGIDTRTSTHTGTKEEYQDPNYKIRPWYWVNKKEVEDQKREDWFVGFRNITNVTNERSAIFSLVPKSGVGHSMPLVFSQEKASKKAIFTALTSSLVFDFVVRQKLGGTNMTYGYVNQFSVLTPKTFEGVTLKLIPLITELYYTSWDIKAFADDIWKEANTDLKKAITNQWEENKEATGGHEWQIPEWANAYPEIAWEKEKGCPLPPFKWNNERRAKLKAELDAYFALLYGLEREELQYVLDPKAVYGQDFPSETFRVLKEKEIKKFGEYRTQRLVLEAYDRLRPGWDMPKHLENLKQIWEECQVDLSEKEEVKPQKEKTSKKKSSPISAKVEEPSANYKMDFGEAAKVSENSKVHIKNVDGIKYCYHISPGALRGEFSGKFKQIDSSSPLAKAMLGKKQGERFKFGKLEYEILEIIA